MSEETQVIEQETTEQVADPMLYKAEEKLKRELTDEQREQLTNFLKGFKRFKIPAKYVVARKILVDKDTEFTNVKYDYVGTAYESMLGDLKRSDMLIMENATKTEESDDTTSKQENGES